MPMENENDTRFQVWQMSPWGDLHECIVVSAGQSVAQYACDELNKGSFPGMFIMLDTKLIAQVHMRGMERRVRTYADADEAIRP